MDKLWSILLQTVCRFGYHIYHQVCPLHSFLWRRVEWDRYRCRHSQLWLSKVFGHSTSEVCRGRYRIFFKGDSLLYWNHRKEVYMANILPRNRRQRVYLTANFWWPRLKLLMKPIYSFWLSSRPVGSKFEMISVNCMHNILGHAPSPLPPLA